MGKISDFFSSFDLYAGHGTEDDALFLDDSDDQEDVEVNSEENDYTDCLLY